MIRWGAFACDTRLALGQRKVDGKSNDISALPELLALLTLDGCLQRGVGSARPHTVVTADAMHCRKATAEAIVARGGDYVLALKSNRKTLLEDIRLRLDDPLTNADDVARTVDGDHGRIETRRATVLHDVAWLAERHGFSGLQAAGKVEATREIDGETTTASRYHILSKPLSAARFLDVVRAHRHVENCRHRVLDVVMDEDQSRARKDNAPARTTGPQPSPDCAAPRSTSSAPTRTNAPREAKSSAPPGMMHSPPATRRRPRRLPWHQRLIRLRAAAIRRRMMYWTVVCRSVSGTVREDHR